MVDFLMFFLNSKLIDTLSNSGKKAKAVCTSCLISIGIIFTGFWSLGMLSTNKNESIINKLNTIAFLLVRIDLYNKIRKRILCFEYEFDF
ncbi:hypothetical protein GCM10022291_30600 [Postechiella marina]|uniref:Uncharacterized protein n=1 Tax=Postechiella marina TaxID=943941 RepID=A0ABP8CFW1_9FLAO